MEQLTPTRLSSVAGISLPYASQIISGNRQPSRSLAIHIFRTAGWKHPLIADLTDEQIDLLGAVEPWQPKGKAA